MFRVILNLHKDIKSFVKNGDFQSNCFTCESGVRQSEQLSPCLFALHLNDCKGTQLIFTRRQIQGNT
jgi:hypothetical protein